MFSDLHQTPARGALLSPPSQPRHATATVDLGTLPVGSTALPFRAEATIYAQEDPAEFVYQVLHGAVRTVSLRGDGRRIVHGFHLPGELFGAEREAFHLCSAEAVCATRVIRCERFRLQALAAKDPEAVGDLWSWLLQCGERTAHNFLFLTHAGAFDRLSYFLLDMASRTASGARVELPMSRYDIGDYLGLSSETVSRTFTALRSKGLIATQGRTVFLLKSSLLRRVESDDDEWRSSSSRSHADSPSGIDRTGRRLS